MKRRALRKKLVGTYHGNAMHIVFLGGGHAHFEVFRRFGGQPHPYVRQNLITGRTRTCENAR